MGLSHLTHLFLDDCSLIGTIPSEIGLLSNLKVLGLYSNFLTGTIPQTIENLESVCKYYTVALCLVTIALE